jgi:thiol peroxidase
MLLTAERIGLVKSKGQAVTILGLDLKPGDIAPEFSVQNSEWIASRGLADTAGKVRTIAAVHSLDTQVCERETGRFNQEAAALLLDRR